MKMLKLQPLALVARTLRPGDQAVYRAGLMAIPQPDPGLLRRAQRHDQDAFRQIVATYQAPLYNYVLRLVAGDAALAEDLCQEILMRVYNGLPGFNVECRFTTWMFQIAKNRVFDELRARQRRPQTPIDLDRIPHAADGHDQGERVEQADAVFRAIGHLNPDLRAALLLRDVVGLSYCEIAEALEITLATTKWRIFKARELTAERLVAEGVMTSPQREIVATD